MVLTLRAVSLHGDPLTQPITVHFDAEGGSIGRADHNTMALPDPKRHISRRQAEVKALGDGVFSIANVGSANPIAVGAVTLARGETAPLAHGDRIRIGGYLLEAEVGAGAGSQAVGIVRPPAAPDAVADASASPPARVVGREAAEESLLAPLGIDGEVPLSAANPFASLLSADAAPPPPGRRPLAGADRLSVPPRSAEAAPGSWLEEGRPPGGAPTTGARGVGGPGLRPIPPAEAAPFGAQAGGMATPPPAWPRLPDDFDPFASPPVTAPAPPSASPASGPIDAFADLVPSNEPTSIDQVFGLGLEPGAGRDLLEDFMASGVPSSPGRGAGGSASVPLSADPLVLFGAPGDRPPAAPVKGAATAADHAPDWQTAFTPPRALRAAESPPPSPPTSASASAAAAAAAPGRPADAVSPAAWAAFCDGVGVAIDRQEGVDADTLRQIGVLLRVSVEGILRLMAVRASAKHELHVPVTVIQAQRNNPLKFSPDASAALEQLLQPPLRGFLPGPEAVEDAMDDLVGHAAGSLAGTRAALEGVLDRFAPRQLEAKLSGRSMLDSVLPMNRRSRLWELYLQHFETIRGEAQEDFHSLFGRAFLTAYEQQLDELRGNNAVASPVQPACG